MLYRKLKLGALYLLKFSGLFYLSRRLTSHGLRILCYHGISVDDEHRFQGMLFMSRATFQQRMRWLSEHNYPVLHLSEALDQMYAKSLPACATVVTIDDGWYGTYKYGLDILDEYNAPATIYVTTYYAEKQTSVFDVAVRYAFWRSRAEKLDLSKVNSDLAGKHWLRDQDDREAAISAIVDFGNSNLDAIERQAMLRDVCTQLEVDDSPWDEDRRLALMAGRELVDAQRRGFDIQLHTHRHAIFTDPNTDIEREVAENRRSLSDFGVAGDLVHFCYPSGQYSATAWPILERSGVQSATVCTAGFNYPTTKRLELKRFLDAEYFTPIEFEAEVSGTLEILRHLRTKLRNMQLRTSANA